MTWLRAKARKIARERINILWRMLEQGRIGDIELDKKLEKRYVELIRKLAMRYNLKLPKTLRRRICKSCGAFLRPGKNAVVRLDSKRKMVIIKCLECGKIYRYPYGREKK